MAETPAEQGEEVWQDSSKGSPTSSRSWVPDWSYYLFVEREDRIAATTTTMKKTEPVNHDSPYQKLSFEAPDKHNIEQQQVLVELSHAKQTQSVS